MALAGLKGRSCGSSFPNEAFRKGDFSALLPATQLYDPTTHAPVPGNILTNDPNFKLSSVIGKVFSFLPATNGSLTNNVIDRTGSSTTANHNSVLNNCGDSEFADNVYQVDDSVSWIEGKHSFKFGGEIRALQFNVRRLTQSSGEFEFDLTVTSANGAGRCRSQLRIRPGSSGHG